MGREVISHIVRFIFFLLLQGLVMNKLHFFGGMMMPFPYILPLILLPFGYSRWGILLIGFFYGISLDMFSSTLGMHTSATVLIAFLIPKVRNLIAPVEGYGVSDTPTIQSQGLSWFIVYAAILTIIHHIWLFYLENFQWANLFSTLIKAILSSILTLAFIILFQHLSFNTKKS